jgi:hypothetical protein
MRDTTTPDFVLRKAPNLTCNIIVSFQVIAEPTQAEPVVLTAG